MKLTPYIIFEGCAEDALHFYKNAFDGEIMMLSRYGDSPMPSDEDYKDKIMHSRLQFEGNMLMISDAGKGIKMESGGHISLSIEMPELDKMDGVFNKLADGGTVTFPLQDMFWGAKFGMLKDKFGITWMLNHEYEKKPTD